MTIAKKNNNTTTVLELHTPPFALLSPLGLLGVVPVAAGAGVRWGEVLALCETAFWADAETHIFHQPLGATSTPPKTSPSHFFKTNQPITKPPPEVSYFVIQGNFDQKYRVCRFGGFFFAVAWGGGMGFLGQKAASHPEKASQSALSLGGGLGH